MVLVIDDDVQMLSVLEFALSADGLHVHLASSGEEGLNLARDIRPELILLDLNMPGMRGDEVVRRLRAEGGHAAQVPVLAFTSEPLSSQDRNALVAIGFTSCLSKQAGIDELLRTVRFLTR